jgi:predicted Zn finger-like uncharacterized protein
MFKVVPDQLRISEGWVRCGQCEEIFDAAAHMQTAEDQVEDKGRSGLDVPIMDAAARGSAAAGDELSWTPPAAVSAVSVDFELEDPVFEDEPTVGRSNLLPDGSAYGVDGPAPRPPEPAGTQSTHDGMPEPGDGAPSRAAPASAAELSFMRSARPSRWHRPLVRATLMVFCLLLMAGLVLQVLVQERDRIAAIEPRAVPLLQELCLHLQCKIGPLRQIESVVIDSSAFSKIRTDAYRLSMTVKNTAPVDLAMPAVELALTDTLDNALVRRVFQPAELGVKSGVIRATSETQATLVLTVKANGNGERVAGYRLLAFYP